MAAVAVFADPPTLPHFRCGASLRVNAAIRIETRDIEAHLDGDTGGGRDLPRNLCSRKARLPACETIGEMRNTGQTGAQRA